MQRPVERFPKELFTAALLVVVLWGLWAAQAFFIPVFLAALLAFLTAPLVRLMQKWRMPEWLAIFVSSLVLLLPVLLVIAVVAHQAQSLATDFPTIVSSAQHGLDQLSHSSYGKHLHLSEKLSISALSDRLTTGAGEGIQYFVHGMRTLVEAGTQVVLIFLFAILMLASRNNIFTSAQKILAQYESIEAGKLLEAVSDLIEKFLLTKLLVIGIVSVLSCIALEILGLKYALLLGIMTGVLTLIPELGFVVGLVPVVLVGIATHHSWVSHAAILGSLIFIHLIEANILTPKLVGKQLNLNVLSTFLGLFAGGLLWGVWGMLLCVPILGVMRIIFSATPAMTPWAELLSEREDMQLRFRLMSPELRSRLLKAFIERRKPPAKQ